MSNAADLLRMEWSCLRELNFELVSGTCGGYFTAEGLSLLAAHCPSLTSAQLSFANRALGASTVVMDKEAMPHSVMATLASRLRKLQLDVSLPAIRFMRELTTVCVNEEQGAAGGAEAEEERPHPIAARTLTSLTLYAQAHVARIADSDYSRLHALTDICFLPRDRCDHYAPPFDDRFGRICPMRSWLFRARRSVGFVRWI